MSMNTLLCISLVEKILKRTCFLGVCFCAFFISAHAKTPPTSPQLSFVPALLSPNPALPLEGASLQPKHPSSHELDEITLEGVAKNPTLEQLRKAPKANPTVFSALTAQKSKSTSEDRVLVEWNQLLNEVAESDLKHLWQSTIDRNPVVRFSLEKIALPAEKHLSHSSEFLRKTLSVLLTGTALATSAIAPTSGYESMGIMTSSQVAQNFVTGRNKPISDLSPTEHIQLSYLIDDLKESLVEHYHAYQQALLTLNQLQTKAQEEDALFDLISKQNDATERFMGIQRYYRFRESLQLAEQKAEKARIQLERIAGPQAVDTLALGIRPQASVLALKPVPEKPVVKKDEPLVASKPSKSPSLPLGEDAVKGSGKRTPPPTPKTGRLPLLEDARR